MNPDYGMFGHLLGLHARKSSKTRPNGAKKWWFEGLVTLKGCKCIRDLDPTIEKAYRDNVGALSLHEPALWHVWAPFWAPFKEIIQN